MRALIPAGERYRYLEIGSYLGASLLPHLQDPYCDLAVSIDKRPLRQYDERHKFYSYEGVTTARMVDLLAAHADRDAMTKLRTHDGAASELDLREYAASIDLAFVDGEHTIGAVFEDFLAIRAVMRPSSLIVFHDALVVFQGLLNVESLLRHEEQPMLLGFFPDSVCAMAFGDRIDDARGWFAANAIPRPQFEAASRQHLIRNTVRNYVVRGIKRLARLERAAPTLDAR